jgi:hypothetical protein
MPNHPLFCSRHGSPDADIRDRIQMALAIADSTALKSLLVNCIPPLLPPQQVGHVSSQVGIPLKDGAVVDGILQFESLHCQLTPLESGSDEGISEGQTATSKPKDAKEIARLTQHESELRTVGQNLPLAIAIAQLAEVGFAPTQIDDILKLPNYAWFKSWWTTLDLNGDFTIPFLRCLRTLRYPDGTLTLQYKDFFAQTKPPCFTSLPQTALVAIRANQQSFSNTLQHINQQRQALNTQAAILICDSLAELEAQAFIHQGVSIFPTAEFTLPMQADCVECDRQECPMNGNPESPVVSCHGFLAKSEIHAV